MVKLQGTEKQIKWAEGIKLKLITKLEKIYDNKRYLEAFLNSNDINDEQLSNAIENLKNEVLASKIIDARDKDNMDLVKMFHHSEIDENLFNSIISDEKIALQIEKKNFDSRRFLSYVSEKVCWLDLDLYLYEIKSKFK